MQVDLDLGRAEPADVAPSDLIEVVSSCQSSRTRSPRPLLRVLGRANSVPGAYSLAGLLYLARPVMTAVLFTRSGRRPIFPPGSVCGLPGLVAFYPGVGSF